MTVREAVELVLEASASASATAADGDARGKIFVLDMGEPVRIVDLARQMIRLAGLTARARHRDRLTGLRPGEKLHEELFHAAEAPIPTAQPGTPPRGAAHRRLRRAGPLDRRTRRAGARRPRRRACSTCCSGWCRNTAPSCRPGGRRRQPRRVRLRGRGSTAVRLVRCLALRHPAPHSRRDRRALPGLLGRIAGRRNPPDTARRSGCLSRRDRDQQPGLAAPRDPVSRQRGRARGGSPPSGCRRRRAMTRSTTCAKGATAASACDFVRAPGMFSRRPCPVGPSSPIAAPTTPARSRRLAERFRTNVLDPLSALTAIRDELRRGNRGSLGSRSTTARAAST